MALAAPTPLAAGPHSQPHSQPDALMADLAAGHPEALGSLYDLLGARAYVLALRIVSDPALAEDVVQQAFLVAWRAARSFRPERGAAAAWILTIVHRRADEMRRDQRAGTPPDSRSIDATVSRGQSDGPEITRVDAALALLNPREREAIELASYAGLTQGEIARALGVSTKTVKHRLHAGMCRLATLTRDVAALSASGHPRRERGTLRHQKTSRGK